jgi:hypothetical protein
MSGYAGQEGEVARCAYDPATRVFNGEVYRRWYQGLRDNEQTDKKLIPEMRDYAITSYVAASLLHKAGITVDHNGAPFQGPESAHFIGTDERPPAPELPAGDQGVAERPLTLVHPTEEEPQIFAA